MPDVLTENLADIMGCAHSHSEDLSTPNRLLQSVQTSDGYFRQTLQTSIDYIIESQIVEKQTEMSYHGPPSHLQNSVDVHPFWHFYGRDYIPKERYVDKSHEKPPGLVPGAENAQQLRAIELHETIHSLRKQVVGVIAKKTNDRKGALKIAKQLDHQLTKEEQSTLDFLEATLNDFDDAVSVTSYNSFDVNMNIDQSKIPVEVDDDLIIDANVRIGTRVHQSMMYFPSVTSTTRQNLQKRIHLQNNTTDTNTKDKKVDITEMCKVNANIGNENLCQQQGSDNRKSNSKTSPFSKAYIEEKPEKEKLERRTSTVRDLVKLFSVKGDRKKVSNDLIIEQEKLHIHGEYKESDIGNQRSKNSGTSKPGGSRRKSIDNMSDDSAIVTEVQGLVDENISKTQPVGHRKLAVSESSLTQKSVDSGIS